MSTQSNWLTIQEVADLLGVTAVTIRRRSRAGWRGFPGIAKFSPRDWRIDRSALVEWLEEREAEAARPPDPDKVSYVDKRVRTDEEWL